MQIVIAVDSPERVDAVQKAGSATGVETLAVMVSADTDLATVYNHIGEYIRGEFVVLADSSLESTGDDWLTALLEYGQHEETGLVAGKSDYPADQPQVTPIPDCSLTSPSYYARFLTTCSVLMNGLQCPQEVRSVGSELCLVRNSLLKNAGGFNSTDFPILFFIHDLCFRLHQQGKIHIYTPYCSSTIKTCPGIPSDRELLSLQLEKARFQHSWFNLLDQGDPFYNQGLLEDRHLPTDESRSWLTGSFTASSPPST
jgi:GT2 family glycosyltransferase